MSAAPELKHNWTPAAYLAYERESDQRHEYLDGLVVAMAGASENHNLIVMSTSASLYGQLRKRPCNVYPSDMRVKIPSGRLYTYPDISVVCDAAEFEDGQRDTLLNPTVIIEVLSPSTEGYDRGAKFQHYRTIASLQEYVLIAQDSIRVEHYARHAEGQWLLTDITAVDDTVMLNSIECTLLVADIYEKVLFDDATDPDNEN